MFTIGADALAQLMTTNNQLWYELSATNFILRTLWTMDLTSAMNVPIRLNVNLGYKWDNSQYLLPGPDYSIGSYGSVASMYALGIPRSEEEYALDIYHDDQVLGAIDVEVPLRWVTPFLQYYTNQVVNSGSHASLSHLSYDESPEFVTPCVRLTPPIIKGFTFDVAADIGLSKTIKLPVSGSTGATADAASVPAWDIMLGASYTFLPPGTTAKAVSPTVEAPPVEGRFSGVVLDERSRQPVEDVLVSFHRKGVADIKTGKDGRFTSGPIPAGIVRVEFSRTGYQSSVIDVKLSAGQTTSQQVLLRKIEKIGAFAGTVKDAAGRPVAAVITFVNTQLPSAVTDPKTGRFFVKLVPGTYKVTVSAQGYASRILNLQIKSMKETVANLVLQKASVPVQVGALAGTIKDAAGKPVAAVITFANSKLPPVQADPKTGRFFVKLTPGTFSVTVSAQGYISKTMNVQIKSRMETISNLVIQPMSVPVQIGALAGTVKDAAGKPVAATVTFVNSKLPPAAADPKTGRFFVKLAPGTYQVTVSAQGYVSKTMNVQIKSRMETIANLVLQLQPTSAPVQIGALAGTVKNTAGKPVAAVVTFVNSKLPPAAADPKTGRFLIKLAPGNYSVTVSAPACVSRTMNVQIKSKMETVINIVLQKK